MVSSSMIPETQEEKDYWSLLESTQRRTYPAFVAQLAAQAGPVAEDGRAAVLEFHDGGQPSIRRFQTSRSLQKFLDTPSASNGRVRQRAFVLQGTPRKFIQVLGSRLRIPPSFFAAHWTSRGFYEGNLLNRTPRHYDNKNRFMLKVPTLHRARVQELEMDKSDPIYYMASSSPRQLSRSTVFGDFDGPLMSYERISFWSVCEEGESWDVVLLVDPPLGRHVQWKNGDLRGVDRGDSVILVSPIMDGAQQEGSWYTPYALNTPLPSTSADWSAMGQAPGMESMFEDILHLYPLEQRQSSPDPRSCTDICRNIVLSAWTAWLRVVEAHVLQEQYRMSTGGGDAPGITTTTWLDKSWTLPWQSRQFGRLIRGKSALEAIEAEVYCNMDALGIGDGQCQSPTPVWEAEAWKTLQHNVQALKARVDIILQAYTQAVSVQESVASNKQARQVGYLTSLATLFIPISFVAAIFSMGGKFSAGESLFWVYWAISIPMVAVGCLVLFTNLGARVLGRGSGNGSLV